MIELKKQLVIGAAAASLLLGGCGAGTAAFVSSAQAADLAQPISQEVGDEAEDEAEGPDVPITGDALDLASAAALEITGEGRVTDTEVGDEEGYYEIEVTLDNGTQVDIHLDENFNFLSEESDAGEVDDQDVLGQIEDFFGADGEAEGPEVPITGEALALASAAALDHLGEGTVTDTEVGDEEGYYEVEVTLDNGTEVDVHLDENFNVLGEEADRDEIDE